MNTNYKVNFENKKIWNNYDPKNIVKDKINLILNYIPEEINSIIDVGCGNGIITNELAKKYKVVGVDRSKEALSHLECTSINSSSESISVNNKEYDLVFSSELLEHLPKEILINSISEFKRISKKYIFITVPNDEFLDVNFIKCPDCNHIFHSYAHLNSFTESNLKELFVDDNYEHVKTDFYGPKKQLYNKFLLKIRQNLGNRWFYPQSNTVCPNCQNTNFPLKKGNVISKICNGLNLIFSKKKPYWMFILFKRK